MDFLVVLEAEDGTWYDEGSPAIGIAQARALARGLSPVRGYEPTIYSLRFVEVVTDDRTNPT